MKDASLNISIFTNEFPPNIYGGAGVHVDYLTRELARHVNVNVECFGDQQMEKGPLRVSGHRPWGGLTYSDPRFRKAFEALSQNLSMTSRLKNIDLVHCHTWYSHFAGLLAKQLLDIPLILTTHSLEPSRPWKVEQLGNAYHLSSWIEKTAYQNADGIIAVSQEMKNDVITWYGVDKSKITIIYNGIDIDEFQPARTTDALRKYQIDPSVPYVLFLGRITHQKGIIHLLRGIKHIRPEAQIVLCAGEPDTPEIASETRAAVASTRKSGRTVIWIQEMVDQKAKIELYTHAAVFVCPSIYEPFGIINLEAMACKTPVVASNVGGISESVVMGETGFLVNFEHKSAVDYSPKHPEAFSRSLAEMINILLDNEPMRLRFGEAARKRVEKNFCWSTIAAQTIAFYRHIISHYQKK